MARRIAHLKGYQIGAVEELLEAYEDIVVSALENGEEVKHGKLYKIFLQELPEKKAWDGLNERYFIREPKKVPKFKPLTRLTDIELPVDNGEEE
jgi:nucleoid DNA-binding protein